MPIISTENKKVRKTITSSRNNFFNWLPPLQDLSAYRYVCRWVCGISWNHSFTWIIEWVCVSEFLLAFLGFSFCFLFTPAICADRSHNLWQPTYWLRQKSSKVKIIFDFKRLLSNWAIDLLLFSPSNFHSLAV